MQDRRKKPENITYITLKIYNFVNSLETGR